MSALGVLFLVTAVSERIVPPSSEMDGPLGAAMLAIWGIFVAEYRARLAISQDRLRFLRRTWPQSILLAIPFLNVVRAGAALRITRLERAVSASLRGTRSARGPLTGRVGWTLTVTVAIVLVTIDVLYEFAGFHPYGAALHDVALATITGEPMRNRTGLSQTIEVFLAVYSVVFFAALAGTLGAFFLERNREQDAESQQTSPTDG